MFVSQNKTAKEALVVVDYQNDFVDGTLGFAGAETLEDGICAEIERVRKAGGDVLFTFDTHAASADEYLQTPEGKALPVPHCLSGSAGHALYGKVAESGTAVELLRQKGVYYKLYKLQAEALKTVGIGE